jgi:translation initiation factor IF-1
MQRGLLGPETNVQRKACSWVCQSLKDKVKVELTPYDLRRTRIVFRSK